MDATTHDETPGWTVLVWFATGAGYVTKGKGLGRDDADKLADAYSCDAKAVRMVLFVRGIAGVSKTVRVRG